MLDALDILTNASVAFYIAACIIVGMICATVAVVTLER